MGIEQHFCEVSGPRLASSRLQLSDIGLLNCTQATAEAKRTQHPKLTAPGTPANGGHDGMGRPFSPASDTAAVSEEERSGPMSIVILGIDRDKKSCSVVGVDVAGAVITRRSMRR